MLTLSEFRCLAREMKNLIDSSWNNLPENEWETDFILAGDKGKHRLIELLLKYTDLSSEDIDLEEELDNQIFGTIEVY